MNYDVEIRYFDSNVQCPKHNIRLSWNGTHETSINNLPNIRKQKYICPMCGLYSLHFYYTFLLVYNKLLSYYYVGVYSLHQSCGYESSCLIH
ncbi:MAG: hypothetical protein LBT66_03345 [Methanobrevibacter sp.]|jgi:hypothetical protein|nr:hypothetical protein [Candidatus Methanovirga meridionalis]